jgi:hypothetical protein
MSLSFLLTLISVAECFLVVSVNRFEIQHCQPQCNNCNVPNVVTSSVATILRAIDNDDNDAENKLNDLGYTKQEIQRSLKTNNKDEVNVRVNLLPEVDSVTLTAVGFALIAFNFFVLANLEDGGIAGLVATIINISRQ